MEFIEFIEFITVKVLLIMYCLSSSFHPNFAAI